MPDFPSEPTRLHPYGRTNAEIRDTLQFIGMAVRPLSTALSVVGGPDAAQVRHELGMAYDILRRAMTCVEKALDSATKDAEHEALRHQ